MAKKPETRFKEHFQAFLKSLPNTWFFKTQERSVRGIPDLIICIRGQFVAFELKPDLDGEPDPLQAYTLDKIHASGGVGVCVHPGNAEQIMKLMIQLSTGKVVIKGIPEDTGKPESATH